MKDNELNKIENEVFGPDEINFKTPLNNELGGKEKEIGQSNTITFPEQKETPKQTKEFIEKEPTPQAIGIYEADHNKVALRLKQINLVADKISELLVAKEDYGVIPGTSKPTLLKSGAEKITMLYNLTPTFKRERVETINRETGELDGITFYYDCQLKTPNGKVVSEGVGSITTFEKKYQNQKPREIENNIMKIGKKRALVDAVLGIGNLSKVFTQDIEEMNIGGASLGGNYLTANEKRELYSKYYQIFINHPKLKSTTQADKKKELKAEWFPKLLKAAGIPKTHFMNFNRDDVKVFDEYIEKNFTNKSGEINE